MNRLIDIVEVFAANAETNIPAFPIAGTGYRNEELAPEDVLSGWQFNKKVVSADHNQVMFMVTSLLQELAQQSVLSWCATTNYKRGGKAIGSNGLTYKAVIDNVNVDPTTENDASKWKVDTGDAPGKFVWFATDVAPPGYLVADHAEKSRLGYPDLFAAIGIRWGAGDGATTFNVPEGRGETLRGFDAGRGVDPGRVFGAWQAGEVGEHTHPVYTSTLDAPDEGDSAGYGIAKDFDNPDIPGGVPELQAAAIGETGGAENLMRNITGLLCVAI